MPRKLGLGTEKKLMTSLKKRRKRAKVRMGNASMIITKMIEEHANLKPHLGTIDPEPHLRDSEATPPSTHLRHK